MSLCAIGENSLFELDAAITHQVRIWLNSQGTTDPELLNCPTGLMPAERHNARKAHKCLNPF